MNSFSYFFHRHSSSIKTHFLAFLSKIKFFMSNERSILHKIYFARFLSGNLHSTLGKLQLISWEVPPLVFWKLMQRSKVVVLSYVMWCYFPNVTYLNTRKINTIDGNLSSKKSIYIHLWRQCFMSIHFQRV